MVLKILTNFVLVLVLAIPIASARKPDSITLVREGSRIIDALATLHLFHGCEPSTMLIEHKWGNSVTEMVVFPNQRLAEMEAEVARNPNTKFRVSGEVFTYDDGNFLLVREAVTLWAGAKRDSPRVQPSSPDIDDIVDEREDDSIASIVADLEAATGSLARSIRSAADNPVERVSPRDEGLRIKNRRVHLVRNSHGAWVVVFVSDATGLSDPPCTVLPSTVSRKLFAYVRTRGLTVPVLVSGEVMTYHGHDFLILRSWQKVHGADHLDG